MVEAYGSHMRLKELATITAPESRMLMVQPFDSANLKAIEKGIQSAGLGLNPAVQGRFIRLVLPEMSKERRQEFVKIAQRFAEEGRVQVRNARRDTLEAVKKAKLPEDEAKRVEKDIQTATDKAIADINTHLASKEKDLLTVG